MHRRTTPKIFANSQELRHNQTEAESKLWQVLRAHQTEAIHFRRQHAIGNYIVDFCSPRKRLIIELDGTPFGRNTLNRKPMTTSARHSLHQKAIGFCAFGTTKC
jgi:very-short-patch-repair endonuclease